MDLKSYSRWYDYSRARDAMLAATDTPWAPWYVANTDDKAARTAQHHQPPAEQGALPAAEAARHHASRSARRTPAYIEPDLPLKHIPTPF